MDDRIEQKGMGKDQNLEQQKRGSWEEPWSLMYVKDVIRKREEDYDKTTMRT